MATIMMGSPGVNTDDLTWLLLPEFRHLASEELLQFIERDAEITRRLWQRRIDAWAREVDRQFMEDACDTL